MSEVRANKACPVVLRDQDGVLEILAFVHPLEGCQLVKGTIEPGEPGPRAALRELGEETGIFDATLIRDLGIWESGYPGQVWTIHLCAVAKPLPESWTHHASDDGGHEFRLFWHPLDRTPASGWNPLYIDALATIRQRLAKAG